MHFLIQTLLALTLSGCFLSAWELSHRSISPFLTLTYVHGGEDARLTHLEAREFCRNLLDRIEEYNAKNKTSTNTNQAPFLARAVPPLASSNPLNRTLTESVHSDLISLHDPTMVHELMGWVLSLEPKQFWIGGLIKLVRDNFRNQNEHLIQLWTDRTPANFRLMHFDNPDLQGMTLGDIKCLAVDYASGKWGVHECDDRMYFVCETIRLPKTSGAKKVAKKVSKRVRKMVNGTMTTTQSAMTQSQTTMAADLA